MYKGSPAPHGGKLATRLLPEVHREEAKKKAAGLPKIVLSARRQADIEMLAVGAYSPLRGFMGSQDYNSVVEKMRLANGLVWPIPVTLDVSLEQADKLKQ